MAEIVVALKERTVTGCLDAEGERPTWIHERLLVVYGEATLEIRTFQRRVRRIKQPNLGEQHCMTFLPRGRHWKWPPTDLLKQFDVWMLALFELITQEKCR
jgi:hypothetical protein